MRGLILLLVGLLVQISDWNIDSQARSLALDHGPPLSLNYKFKPQCKSLSSNGDYMPIQKIGPNKGVKRSSYATLTCAKKLFVPSPGVTTLDCEKGFQLAFEC